jgi:hypothetical protein
MVFKGIVQNGSIKLPPGANLPDGTEVRIEAADDRPLMELVRRLEAVGDDSDWPADGAAELDHYLKGTPKRGI